LGLEQWLSWASASCQLKLWNSIFPIFLKKFVSDKQDMQAGLERGLISPKVLQTFFELDKHPYIAELSHHFQVCYESTLSRIQDERLFGLQKNCASSFGCKIFDTKCARHYQQACNIFVAGIEGEMACRSTVLATTGN